MGSSDSGTADLPFFGLCSKTQGMATKTLDRYSRMSNDGKGLVIAANVKMETDLYFTKTPAPFSLTSLLPLPAWTLKIKNSAVSCGSFFPSTPAS